MRIAILIMLISNFSHAVDRAVIQQMKGKRAILQFETDIPFSVGQKIYVNSDEGTEIGIRKEGRNPMQRKNSIDLISNFANVSVESKVGTTKTTTTAGTNSLSGRYGWNMEQFEFGALGSYSYAKAKNSSEVSSYQVGGFFDYNFIPNKPGEDFIWGAYGEGTVGNTKASSVSRGSVGFTAGGFVKWFILSPMLALRINAFYNYENQDQDYINTTTGMGFGLSHYF
jgi:hypothetical protein